MVRLVNKQLRDGIQELGEPSEKDKFRKRRRMKNKYAKDLRTPKYRQRIVEDKAKKVKVQDLSHAELVKLINQETKDVE